MARTGDAAGVRAFLAASPAAVDALDGRGATALFEAVGLASPDPEVVRALLEAGADPNFTRVTTIPRFSGGGPMEFRESLPAAALKGGDLATVRTLRESGADLGYRDAHGTTAMLDATCGRGDRVALVRYLLSLGLAADATMTFNGGSVTAVAAASQAGRFDVVAELLGAGADAARLGWTALHRAAALGTADDARAALAAGVDRDAFDGWGRRAIHLTLLRGDAAIVDALLAGGAAWDDHDVRSGSGLRYAVEGDHPGLIARILAVGAAAPALDAALEVAVEAGRHRVAEALLAAGADPRPPRRFGALIEDAPDRETILLLERYGADLGELDQEGRRRLVGLGERDEGALDGISRAAYRASRYGGEGRANPERIDDPFRCAMVRAGESAYGARLRFEDEPTFEYGREPNGIGASVVWCFDRFGQSTTRLPDGRTVLVAGEHDDGGDPDFRIYNDVAVFEPDGSFTLYGYPFAVFPPTDFHTATLVGEWILLIGSAGYPGSREGGIPVYRLRTTDFRIERVATTGEDPGRLYGHRATLLEGGRVRIEGGKRIELRGAEETPVPNAEAFTLDVGTSVWSRS